MKSRIKISQIELVAAILAEIARQNEGVVVSQIDMGIVINAADLICLNVRQEMVDEQKV